MRDSNMSYKDLQLSTKMERGVLIPGSHHHGKSHRSACTFQRVPFMWACMVPMAIHVVLVGVPHTGLRSLLPDQPSPTQSPDGSLHTLRTPSSSLSVVHVVVDILLFAHSHRLHARYSTCPHLVRHCFTRRLLAEARAWLFRRPQVRFPTGLGSVSLREGLAFNPSLSLTPSILPTSSLSSPTTSRRAQMRDYGREITSMSTQNPQGRRASRSPTVTSSPALV